MKANFVTHQAAGIKGELQQDSLAAAEEKVHQEETVLPADMPEASSSLPKCFLIIHSVSKRQNIGNLLRSATAFGVSEVINCDRPGML